MLSYNPLPIVTKPYQCLVDLAIMPYQTLPILTGFLATDANSLGVFGLVGYPLEADQETSTIAYQTLPDPTVAV